MEIQVCVEYLPDYFKKVTSAFEVNSVFKFESRVPWALLSSSMWQAKVCQLEVGEKRGKEIISMKNGEKTNIEEMTKQSVYSVQCEKEISEESNDEKAKQSCIILDKLVLVPGQGS